MEKTCRRVGVAGGFAHGKKAQRPVATRMPGCPGRRRHADTPTRLLPPGTPTMIQALQPARARAVYKSRIAPESFLRIAP
jgi:hypothetical protein